jgi:hypothetical protein
MRLEAPCEFRPNQAGSFTPTLHPSPQRRRWKVILIPLVLLALTGSPPCASADFIFTASGSSQNGALAAEADFIIGTDTITVVLKNLQTEIGSAGQAISGLSFTASNPPTGGASLALQSYSGDVVNVNGDGSVTDFGTTTYSGSTLSDGHWGISSSNGMTALTGGQPDHMILGPPNYATTGNVIGNGQFNPWFANSATFVLSAQGVTPNSTISNVVFSFGTSSSESHLNGSPTAVTPAPSAVILLASGAICIAGFTVLSRRRRQAA